jgi:Fic family protein
MQTQPTWIWTAPTWPRFVYDRAALAEPVRLARIEEGRLLGQAEAVGAEEQSIVRQQVWTGDAVATAAIEGEKLDLQSVRSSVARRLGVAPTLVATVPRNVEGLLDVMEDAAANWDSDLTEERLFRWQAALFPDGHSGLRPVETGRYRTRAEPMQIVSGPVGKETVHYEAPPSAAVRPEMRNFLDWFNRSRGSGDDDGILRAGIAHLWFESIHPFHDGNGRVGRAIADMALAQDARRPFRLHGLSTELLRQKADYYDRLNQAQRGSGEITAWLAWFTRAFIAACQGSGRIVAEALARARFWSDHSDTSLNPRQRKALNAMLEAGPGRFEGGMTPRKYRALTRAASTTATRDLTELVAKGLLVRGGGGRSSRYDLAIPGWQWTPRAAASGRRA